MGKTSDKAKRLEGSGSEDGAEAVLALIGRAVIANQRLQDRIADGEERLRAKANELANHRRAARTDFFNGLPKRRTSDIEMARRFNEWQRLETPFTLMLVDLDRFKSPKAEHGQKWDTRFFAVWVTS